MNSRGKSEKLARNTELYFGLKKMILNLPECYYGEEEKRGVDDAGSGDDNSHNSAIYDQSAGVSNSRGDIDNDDGE